MRLLFIAFVILIYLVFFEKDSKEYIVPFSIASLVCTICTISLAFFFDLNIDDVVFLRSGSELTNVVAMGTYISLLIPIVSVAKFFFHKYKS
jgi:hypothetical protein